MNDHLQALVGPDVIRLGWALSHFLWQGVLILALLEMALQLAGRKDASLRYLLCGAALAFMPVCLVVTYAALGPAVEVPNAPAVSVPAMTLVPPAALNSPPSFASLPVVVTVAEFTSHEIPPFNLNRFMPTIVGLWLTGVVLLTSRKAGGFFVLWRLRRRGISTPDDIVSGLFCQACAKMGVDPRHISLKVSSLVQVPMTMGWVRPIVLFPAVLLSGLGPNEIELLIEHELAHIRRSDYLANLLQTVVETLFFYHPVAWWISRRMRQERENCCDDLVIQNSGDKLAYARTLVRLEELHAPEASLIQAASGGRLRQRIERMLGVPAPGLSGGVTIVLICLLSGAFAAFSFGRGQVPVPPVALPLVVTETKEVMGDVGRLYHAMVLTQTSVEKPKPASLSWQLILDMANNAFPVTAGTVSLPPGSAWATNPVAVVKPDLLVGAHYLYVQAFQSKADLLANFPDGEYGFNIQPGIPGSVPYSARVSSSKDVGYPPMAPVITNTTWDAGVLVLDPTSAVINYTNYPGATLTWEIVIPGKTYIMSAGGGGSSGGSLNLTGMLAYGQTYVAQLRFINRDKSSTVSDPASPKDYGYSTMTAQIVEFTIKTPATASVAPSPVSTPPTTVTQPTSGRIVAIVNRHSITSVEVDQKVAEKVKELGQSYSGDELKQKIASARSEVVDTIVDRWLIIDDFLTSGGSIPEKYVNDRIDDVVKDQYGGNRNAFLQALAGRGSTLEKYKEEIEGNAIVAYMRNRFVVQKVWDYYQTHLDLFPADEQINVTVVQARGSTPVPAGQLGNFDAETDPRAEMVRKVLSDLKSGADVSKEISGIAEGVNPRFNDKPTWVTKERIPSYWPFKWDEIENLKPGQTIGVVVEDGWYSHGDDDAGQNFHDYWMLRVNGCRPAKVAATAKTSEQEKELLNVQSRKIQEDWLGTLRAKASVQRFDGAGPDKNETDTETTPAAPSDRPTLVAAVNQPSGPAVLSVQPSSPDNPVQQRYISDETERLTKRMNLTSDQASTLRAAMHAVVHHEATKTVDQSLKEILSPEQEAIWEQIKTEARGDEARMYAMYEMNRIATLLPLSDAQKLQVQDALTQVRLNDQHRDFHSLAESTAHDVSQAQSEESALAKILSPGQMIIFDQEEKAQLLETKGELPYPVSLTDSSTWWPQLDKKPTPPMAPLPKLSLQYNLPGQ